MSDYRATLDQDDREFLDEILASRMTGARISDIIKAADGDLKAHTIQRHRRGDCGCP